MSIKYLNAKMINIPFLDAAPGEYSLLVYFTHQKINGTTFIIFQRINQSSNFICWYYYAVVDIF